MLVQNMVLLSLPYSLSCLISTLVLLGKKDYITPARAMAFSGVYAVFSMVSTWLVFPFPEWFIVRQVVASILVIGMFWVLFGRDRNQALLLAAIYLTLLTMLSMLTSGLETFFTGSRTFFFDTPVSHVLIFGWPVYALCLLVCIRLSQSRPGRLFRKLSGFSQQRFFFWIALIVILQCALVTGTLMSASALSHEINDAVAREYWAVGLCFLIFFVCSLTVIGYAVSLAEDIAVQTFEGRLSRQVQDIALNLKSTRHDFIHHVQVLAILFESGNTDEFRSYLSQIDREMRDTAAIVQAPQAWLDYLRDSEDTGGEITESLVKPIG